MKEQEFAPELADRATSLWQECGRNVSRARLVTEVMGAFEACYEEFLRDGFAGKIMERYNGLLVNRNREVLVLDPQGEFRGISRGVNEEGLLLVEREEGSVVEVYAGEVSVRGIYGYV